MPAPVPALPCVLPSGVLTALAFPIPGATNVPDSPGQIVVAVSSSLPATWQLVVQIPGVLLQGESLLTTIAPSAIPTPYAVPTFAAPTYEASGLTSALPPASTINVLLNDESSPCNQYVLVGSFGTH